MQDYSKLKARANWIRKEILKMINTAGSGHPGGSLSAADLVTYLYFHQLRLDPQRPQWEDRDRFVLSKGHAAPVLYAALAGRGFFPPSDLATLRQRDSHLQGHPDMKGTPGVDISTGSLGQGISAALGMALAGRLDDKDYRVYFMIGDGEANEGQVWEAAMAAAHHQLENLVGIMDYNRLQLLAPLSEVMDISPVAEKWKAFGWHVIEIDGHDFSEIDEAFQHAIKVKGRPVMIVAHTVKGKGVSYMEDNPSWHGKAPEDEELEQALQELSKRS